jgi:hypothetical protein
MAAIRRDAIVGIIATIGGPSEYPGVLAEIEWAYVAVRLGDTSYPSVSGPPMLMTNY